MYQQQSTLSLTKNVAKICFIIIVDILTGCSNSESIEFPEWRETITNNNEINKNEESNDCFDRYRQQNSQSTSCNKNGDKPDTIIGFPQSGFFETPFIILFANDQPMYCESGGIPPSEKSPLISNLRVDSSTTIRCSFHPTNQNNKKEIIRTYILEKQPTIPTIFLTTDPKSLFDPDSGIYVDGPNAEEKEPHYGANYWLDKEIPVYIELVEPYEHLAAFAKHAGLKIAGNYSRIHPKKSVTITFRKNYGDKRLYYTLFPEFPNLNTFKSFTLRNFGNNFGWDYIRDRLSSSISKGLGVDYQQGRFVIVYYNGKYFGLHDLRERTNEYYFETHYGFDPNNINLLKADNQASAGSATDFISLTNWIKEHNLESDENYSYVSTQIDLDNYINYMQVEIFANNRDWPGNNQKKWNCSSPKTLWKWFLYDLDWSFINSSGETSGNIFEYISSEHSKLYANLPNHTFLFRSLLKNENFKTAFINRMTTLLQLNFETSRVTAQINKLMNEIQSEIPRDQERWSLSATKMDNQLKNIKAFAQKRPSTIIKELREFFKLGNPTPFTLSTNGPGSILVHGLLLESSTATITFFEKLPVTISAEPQSGHSFLKWSDGETNPTRIIWPGQDKSITAIFK